MYFVGQGQDNGRKPKLEPETPETPARVSLQNGQDEHRSFNTMVGEAIRRSRQERGWTQAFLAEQAGLSPNYIARLERGELGPSLFVANRIGRALTITLDTLVRPVTDAHPTRKTLAGRRARVARAG